MAGLLRRSRFLRNLTFAVLIATVVPTAYVRAADYCAYITYPNYLSWVNPCDKDCATMFAECGTRFGPSLDYFYCNPPQGTPTAGYCGCYGAC